MSKWLVTFLFLFVASTFFGQGLKIEDATVSFQIGHQSSVSNTFISSSGRYIISNDIDGNVVFWDFYSRKELFKGQISNFQKSVSKVVFSDDEEFAWILVGQQSTIYCFNLKEIKLVKKIARTSGINGIIDMALSPNGEKLVYGMIDGRIEIVNSISGKRLSEVYGVPSVEKLSFLNDELFIAYSSLNNRVSFVSALGQVVHKVDDLLKSSEKIVSFHKSSLEDNSVDFFLEGSGLSLCRLDLSSQKKERVSKIKFENVESVMSHNKQYYFLTSSNEIIKVDQNSTEIISKTNFDQSIENSSYSPNLDMLIGSISKDLFFQRNGMQKNQLRPSLVHEVYDFTYNSSTGNLILANKINEQHNIELFHLYGLERNKKSYSTGKILKLKNLNDDKIIYSESAKGKFYLRLLNIETGKRKFLYEDSDTILFKIHENKCLVYGEEHKEIISIDLENSRQNQLFDFSVLLKDKSLYDFIYSEKNKCIVYSWSDYSGNYNYLKQKYDYSFGMNAVDLTTGEVKIMQKNLDDPEKSHSGVINHLLLSEDERWLYSGGINSLGASDMISITHAKWDMKTLTFHSKLGGKSGHCFSMDLDNQNVYSGGLLYGGLAVWDREIDSISKMFFGLSADVNRIQKIKELPVLMCLTKDNNIVFWFYENDKSPTINLSFYSKDDFVMYDSEMNYCGTKRMLQNIFYRKDGVLFPFDQIGLGNNRPDLLLSKLMEKKNCLVSKFERINSNLNIAQSELVSNDKKIEFLVEKFTPFTSEKLVTLEFSSKLKSNDLTITTFLNGVPIPNLKLVNTELGFNLNVPLVNDQNQITISFKNKKGELLHSQDIVVDKLSDKLKPKVYALIIGVGDYDGEEFDLKYATKDASDFSSFIDSEYEGFDKEILLLLNEDFSDKKVLEFRNILKDAKEDDILFVFYAGHGVLDYEFNYFLGTSSIDFQNPASSGFKFENIDSVFLSNRIVNKVMFVDACHSGSLEGLDIVMSKDTSSISEEEITFRSSNGKVELVESDCATSSELLLNNYFQRVGSVHGATIIASAGGREFALESDKWSNGVFTSSLIKGLRNFEADINNDGEIRISELQKFCISSVLELSNGAQRPTCREENFRNDFIVLRKE